MADMDTEVKDRYRQDVRDNIQTMVPGFTGQGTAGSPYTNMSGPGATPPVDPKIELERMKLNSISPDSLEKIGNFFTNLTGPARGLADTYGKGIRASYEATTKPWVDMYQQNIGQPFMENIVNPIAGGISGDVRNIVGGGGGGFQPIPAQTTQAGFTTPRYTKENPYTGQKPWVNDFLAKSHVSPTVNMTQDATGTWIPAEGGRYMLGPENPTGDIAARNAIRSDFGTAPADRGYWETGLAVDPETQQRQQIYRPEGYRSYYDAHPDERLLDDLEYRMKPFMDQYNKLVEDTRSRAQGYGLPMNPMTAEGMRAGAASRLSAMADQKLMPIPDYSNILQQSPGSPANQARLAQIPIAQQKLDLEKMGMPSEIAEREARSKHYNKPQYTTVGPDTIAYGPNGEILKGPTTGRQDTAQERLFTHAFPYLKALTEALPYSPPEEQKLIRAEIDQLKQRMGLGGGITEEKFLADAKRNNSKLSEKELKEAYRERMARGSK